MDRSAPPSRTVHCEEALAWLEAQPVLEGCSFVTSLPDVSEVGLALEPWRGWFSQAARAVLARCPEDGLAIFYQTDIRQQGEWIDKGYLVSAAAEREGFSAAFHKVVCRVPPGARSSLRAGFSHLLGFSRRRGSGGPAMALADVLPSAGEATWTRGMGLEACRLACELVVASTPTRTVVDPFCGHGTVLAVANAMGLDAVGVERSAKRARKARGLQAELRRGSLVLLGGERPTGPPSATSETRVHRPS